MQFKKLNADNFKERTKKWMRLITKRNLDIEYNSKNTILLVIDAQNYFFDKNSNAYFKNSDIIIDNLNSLISLAESNRISIIYSIHFNSIQDNNSMIKWWKDLPKKDSENCKLYSKVKYVDNSKIIFKNTYSVFSSLSFNKYLITNNIKNIIISGVKTNLCCETTARDAFLRDYNVLFVADATTTNNEFMHLSSLNNLSYGFCEITTTKKLHKYFV